MSQLISSVVIDLALLAFLVFSYLRGRKKGFILVLCGLAAIFVALFGARLLSQQLAPAVADALTPHFTTLVEEQMEANATNEELLLTEGEGTTNPLSEFLQGLGFEESYTSPVRDTFSQQVTQAATDTVTALARAIAQTVAEVIVFIVAFLLLLLLWWLLSRLLNLAAHLPGIKGLNKLLGGLFGLIRGILLMFLIVWILRMCGTIPTALVESTYVLRFFATISPISILAGI